MVAERVLPADTDRANAVLDFAQPEDTLFWRVYPQPGKPENTTVTPPGGIIFVEQSPTQSVEAVAEEIFTNNDAELSPVRSTVSAPETETGMLPAEQEKLPEITQADVPSEPVPAVSAFSASPEVTVKEPVPAPQPAAENQMPIQKTPEKPAVQKPAIVSIKPVLLKPAAGKILGSSDFNIHSPQIIFTWHGVKGASSYIFALYKGKYTTKPLFSVSVKGTSFTLKGARFTLLENGSFSWTVRAVASLKGKRFESLQAYSGFSIELPEPGQTEIDTSNLVQTQ